MWTLTGLLRALKKNPAGWERVGEWDGSSWHLREPTEGLTDWLSDQERKDSDVWSLAVREGQRITIRSIHFDYLLVPLGDGLTMERRPR